jgi:nucleotide-binding universal stress UspA family protein
MFKRILIAYDGSKPAKHALDFGTNLSDRDGAELVLLTARAF